MRLKNLLPCLLLIACTFAQAQKKYTADWASIDSRATPTWFTNAKFGIFIHWGLYSVPSWGPTGKDYGIYDRYSEWYWKRMISDSTKLGKAFRAHHQQVYGPNFKYEDFAPMFKAELFNPDKWADLFVASGAKYVVLTSKHHEGFALWPSQEAWNWNSVDVGPHRDLAGDLMKSVKAKGLRMGYYYSMYEWFNPLYHSDVKLYVDEHMLPQLKDLVTRYHPDIVWPDGEWEQPSSTWKSTEFLAWLFNDSPVKDDVAINDRWGKETRGKHGGYYTTEYDLVNDSKASAKITHPWEECRGMAYSFGLNRDESLADYSTPEQLIHVLIEKVSKGGNLLLDIGPAADGSIPVIMQERLLQMGAWLKVNGEAIYDTESWNDAPADKNIHFTRKGKDLYVLCDTYPTSPIKVGKIKKPGNVTMLGVDGVVNTTYSNNTLTITPPAYTLNSGQYAWVFKLSGVLN